jgi:hypothetical protein
MSVSVWLRRMLSVSEISIVFLFFLIPFCPSEENGKMKKRRTIKNNCLCITVLVI